MGWKNRKERGEEERRVNVNLRERKEMERK